jgi:hypothetical protein
MVEQGIVSSFSEANRYSYFGIVILRVVEFNLPMLPFRMPLIPYIGQFSKSAEEIVFLAQIQ